MLQFVCAMQMAAATVAMAPQAAAVVQDSGEKKSVVKVVIQNENGELRYVDENGKVQVLHDGRQVPANRIQRDGQTMRVLGPDGKTLYEFRVGGGDGGNIVLFGNDGEEGPRIGSGAPLTVIDQPKGRIGVYLASVDEAQRKELGIDSESAITITAVADDSPAAEAGLAGGDIVIRVNGQSASLDSLRETVSQSEPGKAVVLTIVRDGETKDVKVKVGKPEQINMEGLTGVWSGEGELKLDGGMELRLEDLQGRLGTLHDHVLRFVPEGKWENFEGLQRIDPQAFERLREKFGEGQEFMQLHVTPFVERRWGGGVDAERLHKSILEAIENAHLQLDDKTRAQIHEAVKQALQNSLSNVHEVEVQLQEIDEMPMLFDLMKKGEGEHIMVLPEGGQLRLAPQKRLEVDRITERVGSASDRLDRLEERLQKLEGMLQKLLEREGARLP